MAYIPVTQDDIDNGYSLVSELRDMIGSSEKGYGFTEEQIEKLAEKSGVPVDQFRHAFFAALQRIAG